VEGDQPYLLKTFRVSPDLLDDAIYQVWEGRRRPLLDAVMLDAPDLATQLAALHGALAAGSNLAELSVQTHRLGATAQLFSRSVAAEREADDGALSLQQWTRIRGYCHAHLGEKIKLESLAALCRISRFLFLRRFAKRAGITPHAWLLRLRLERSCQLLGSKTSRVSDVALDVGFYDQSHFDRAFKRAYGVTASGYCMSTP
jgi:AraC-like DNA-binding protein